jgi:MFS family permease
MSFPSRNVLFGESPTLNSRRTYEKVQDELLDNETPDITPPSGLSGFFFSFMYEDEDLEESSDDILYRSTVESTTNIWNPLNAALFLSLMLSAVASAVPVTIVATMSDDLFDSSYNNQEGGGGEGLVPLSFAPRAAAAAVLGTSFGKFLNGPVVDVFGARRTAVLYNILLAVSLLGLAACRTVDAAAWACFLVEFCYSVQWPCCIVTLATHYRGSSSGMYEGGIYVTSLAARLGSLLGIPCSSLLMRWTHWRLVAVVGAWVALVASSVTFLFVTDSVEKVNEPQNPIDPVQLKKWFPESFRSSSRQVSLHSLCSMVYFVFKTNVLPSLRHVLRSGTFWLVAFAHTGSAMLGTCTRILGTYLFDTSMGTLSENRAAGLAVFFPLGTVLGLIVAGNMFAAQQERERKWLVSRLYMLSISACYLLALLAIPALRNMLHAPALVTTFQVMAISTAGFGIAVQFYHIPSLVGATFGADKGLFSAYTDGVAYGLASLVWRIVARAVSHGNSAQTGGGWAYGWAAVALLLVLSALLMVEFMEHFFCRRSRHAGGNNRYETIIFA